MVITTKVCCHCHQSKPIREFNKDSSQKDGHYKMCKVCSCEIQKKSRYKKKNIVPIEDANKVIGGYKVAILNHPSRTESKFNIVGTDGYYYATNETKDFMDILRGLVWKTRS